MTTTQWVAAAVTAVWVGVWALLVMLGASSELVQLWVLAIVWVPLLLVAVATVLAWFERNVEQRFRR